MESMLIRIFLSQFTYFKFINIFYQNFHIYYSKSNFQNI